MGVRFGHMIRAVIQARIADRTGHRDVGLQADGQPGQ
jgi:hypothetical protein